MHELSVAESIVRLTEEKISLYPDKKPVKIVLDIGLISGIDFDALDFAMKSAVKNSSIENADIVINRIEPEAECMDCHRRFKADDYLVNCPDCQGFNISFLKGKELLIRSIELE
jgi:hydrogenase nickel incorporation protein HypA/HybF